MELDTEALSGHAKEKAMPEQKPQNIKPKETADPLPSWNDSNVKRSILDFVTRVSTEGGAEFVPPVERIAVFDNDGTLWCGATDIFPGIVRLRPHQATGPATSGMENQGAVRLGPERR